MIIDKLENVDLYYESIDGLERFIQFYNDNDLEELPPCRLKINGDDLFVNIAEIKGKEMKDIPLEAHRDYIDVQIPLTQTEKMGWKPQEDCQDILRDYDEGKDVELYRDHAVNTFAVPVGCFAIFFPSDAHQPGIVGEGTTQKKLIAKIKVQGTK